MRNAEYTDQGSINKRAGYQTHAKTAGGFGLWTYQKADPVTGVVTPEVVTVDQNLWRQKQATLSVVYSGLNDSCQLSVYLDAVTSTYKCQIIEGTTEVLNFDLGVGFDEVTPVTLADLDTAISALVGFSATVTGDNTTPAAFLKIVRSFDLSSATGGTYSGVAKYWEQIYSPLTNPLALYYANRNNEDSENVSSVQTQNTIYFATGFTECFKYDGQSFYRAGLPTPDVPTVALVAGAVTGNNYRHVAQYIYHDKAGNIIEGNPATSATNVNAAANSFDVTVSNILNTTGFNTNCAIVNGAQVAVTTITVLVSNTLQVGDTAYFFDAVSADYVERLITARTATSITIAGAAVTVANNDVISANLRIGIYRSKTSGTTPTVFYLVKEVPNNSFAATQVVNDNITDINLGRLFLSPATDRSPPPKGRYIQQWNGIGMLGGIPDDPSGLAFSDVDGFEYFPNDSNRLLIEPGNGDVVNGVFPNNEVFTVHGPSSFTVITGDITTGQIRVETKSRDVGCASHASLTELDGVLVWLSARGPVYSQGGQVPLPLGQVVGEDRSPTSSRIDPEFDNSGKPSNLQLIGKRSVGFTDPFRSRWILFVPAEEKTAGELHPNEFSKVFVYDKTRDAWLIWNNLNMASGMTAVGMEFYFQERRYSDFLNAVESKLYRRLNLIDEWDYADNTGAVNLDYSPQWEFLGEPSVLKKATKVKIFSIEDQNTGPFTVVIDQEINFQKDTSATTFSIEMLSGGYGINSYGIDAYGDPSDGSRFHTLNRDRTFSTRTRFKNEEIHENVVISGWEMELDAPYRPDFKP